jgi:hypothetical protein
MPSLFWPSTGRFDQPVVGTRAFREQIARFAKNPDDLSAHVLFVANLVPENENPQDDQAVCIQVGGQNLGYLSRQEARSYRERLVTSGISAQPLSVYALLASGFNANGKQYEYRMVLDIPSWPAMPQAGALSCPAVVRNDTSLRTKQVRRGRYEVEAWLSAGAINDVHRKRLIKRWTTRDWNTINYYLANSGGIGLGHKLFEISKTEHRKMFGSVQTLGEVVSIEGFKIVVSLRRAPAGTHNERTSPEPGRDYYSEPKAADGWLKVL